MSVSCTALVPTPIKLNNYQANKSYSATPQTITNNFLKQVHLEGRHSTTTNDEQQQPPLTREEAIMASIDANLRRPSWTIHNLDQLHLIQEHIKIVAKIIDEDRQNIKRYNDDDDEETQLIRRTTPKPSTNHQTKKVFTLADLNEKDRVEYRPHLSNALATPPREFHVPGALEEADWDLSLLKELDRIAVQLRYRSGENYRQLADRLIQECHISSDDQKSKVRAIFVWITSHIRYDIKMSPRDNSLVGNEGKMDELCQLILNTQSCVCVGYAVLFKRMCQHFNVRVDYVRGYTKRTKSCINDTAGADKSDKLSGHAWTMVHLNGKTYFTDPTWSAASWSSSNEMKSPFTNTYYLVVPKHAIYQFRPDNDCDQHIADPWTIVRFTQEPCFYPNYFRSKFTLEDRDTEWYYYRLIVDRSKQTSFTKSFCITTRKSDANSKYPRKMYGYIHWHKNLSALADDLSPIKNTDYEHEINAVKFKQIDPTLADTYLNDKRPIFIAELKDIPIYPPKLDVYQIQYGLLRIYATDQSNGRYEPIFECIFEFQ